MVLFLSVVCSTSPVEACGVTLIVAPVPVTLMLVCSFVDFLPRINSTTLPPMKLPTIPPIIEPMPGNNIEPNVAPIVEPIARPARSALSIAAHAFLNEGLLPAAISLPI